MLNDEEMFLILFSKDSFKSRRIFMMIDDEYQS